MAGPPPRRVLVAVGLITACTLGFQVVFTRMLSAVLAYHFGFLAISLGLLGTGAGALAVYLKPDWFNRIELTRMLALWCAAFAVVLIALPYVFVHLDFSTGADRLSQHFSEGLPFILNVAAACVLAAIPSLTAGVVIALAITGYTKWIGGVYAADLVGAGVGALVVVPLLYIFDAPTLTVVLGIAAAVAPCSSPDRLARAEVVGRRLALGVVLTLLAVTTSALFLPPRYGLGGGRPGQVAERWNPLSRVLGYSLPDNPDLAAVLYDRVYAPVVKVKGNTLPDWKALHLGPQSIGYKIATKDGARSSSAVAAGATSTTP